ncbi:MAG: nitroreductase [Frankiales bacterium]|nr:nitroreductase [Frankiales bacterium]
METWDAIRARRNVRTYTSDPVPEQDLIRIVEAGWRAPSASNRQHWDFVIVTDPGQITELSTVWPGASHIAGAPAAIALVVPEPADDRTRVVDQYDLGQATYAIILAATDLGIGTGHSSVGDQAKARAILGVPETRRVLPAWGWLPGRPPTAAHHKPGPPPPRRGRTSRTLVTRFPPCNAGPRRTIRLVIRGNVQWVQALKRAVRA